MSEIYEGAIAIKNSIDYHHSANSGEHHEEQMYHTHEAYEDMFRIMNNLILEIRGCKYIPPLCVYEAESFLKGWIE